MKIGIAGIQEAQRGNALLMAKFRPGGAFSKLIWQITMSLHRYAVSITHVDTGALRASHRMRMVEQYTGYIWIDHSSVNPKSGASPYKYGLFEEERGGSHAFYYRTVHEAAPRIIASATKGFL